MNDASLARYDVTPCGVMMFSLCENDAMFASKTLGKADIIHEVNIISDSDIICRRQTSLKKSCFMSCHATRFMRTVRFIYENKALPKKCFGVSCEKAGEN